MIVCSLLYRYKPLRGDSAPNAALRTHTAIKYTWLTVMLLLGLAIYAGAGTDQRQLQPILDQMNLERDKVNAALGSSNPQPPAPNLGARDLASTATPSVEVPNKVFAWYMTPFYTYSLNATDAEAVAGYKRDIQAAQAAGVDGFALYVAPLTYLFENTANMFEAAKQLHDANPTSPPFLLHLSPEAGADAAVRVLYPETNTNWIVYFVSAFASHPNYFRYQNRPVLTPFLGLKVDIPAGVNQQSDWVSYVFTTLSRDGINVFFVHRSSIRMT